MGGQYSTPIDRLERGALVKGAKLKVETPSGGLHVWVQWPEGVGNSAVFPPGTVDVRGDRSNVPAPGSRRSDDGRAYKLVTSPMLLELASSDVAGMLPEMKALWFETERMAAAKAAAARERYGPPRPERERSPEREALWLDSKFERRVTEIRNTGEGGRNQTISASAFHLGQYVHHGRFSAAEIEDAIEAIIRTYKPIEQPGMMVSLKRGIREGMAMPKEINLKDDVMPWRARGNGDTEPPTGELPDGPDGNAGKLRPWPDPLEVESDLPPVLQFDPSMLPEHLRGHVIDVAHRQQCPVDFVAVAALCGLSAMVGNHILARPKQEDDWTIVPNLWGAAIGRPGSMKSPAISAALAPVNAIERELLAGWEAEKGDEEIEQRIGKLEAKSAERDAKAALREGDRDRARELLAASGDDDDDGRPMPRIVVNDATVEKLGELLNENPRGLLLVRDELAGFMAKMNDERYQGDRAFYLEAYNGDKSFVYDRILRGTIRIDRATLSIIGGIQPSRVAPIVSGTVTGTSDDGLVQRFQMAVWPNDPLGWTLVDQAPDRDALNAYREAFVMVRKTASRFSTGQPCHLRFEPDAQGLFNDWLCALHQRARGDGIEPALESHMLKMQKTIASLALLFELCGTEDPIGIGEASLRRALMWAPYLESHAGRVYSAGNLEIDKAAQLILSRRDQLPSPFTHRDVYRKHWSGLSDRDAVDAVIARLEETSNCREIEPENSNGRPSRQYEWNPKLGGKKYENALGEQCQK
jgi:hypothetical protein